MGGGILIWDFELGDVNINYIYAITNYINRITKHPKAVVASGHG